MAARLHFLGLAGYVDPVLPAAGHLCMARRNRLLIFRADLLHGSLPEKIWRWGCRQEAAKAVCKYVRKCENVVKPMVKPMVKPILCEV